MKKIRNLFFKRFVNGFTLTEVVLVMLIIAVVVGVCIKIAKTKLGKITAYTYYSAYSTLDSAAKEMLKDYKSTNPDYAMQSQNNIAARIKMFFVTNFGQMVFAAIEQVEKPTEPGQGPTGGWAAPGGSDSDLTLLTCPANAQDCSCNSDNVVYRGTTTSSNGTLVQYCCCAMTVCNPDREAHCGETWDMNQCKFVTKSGWPPACPEGQVYDSSDSVCGCVPDSSQPGGSSTPGACSIPDPTVVATQYCTGKEFDNTPGVCGWKDITPWPPVCPEGQIWNNAETDCKCIPAPPSLPKTGANFCKLFSGYVNTSQGLLADGKECAGEKIDDSVTDFSSKKPDLVLRNGMIMYNLSQNPIQIPDLLNNTYKGSFEGVDNTNEWGYVVYIDIDGKKGMNKLWEDVYPFYVTLAGYVIPVYDKENPQQSGGDSIEHLQTSVLDEFVDDRGSNNHWVTKSKSFKESACKSGYVGLNTPYCTTAPSFTLDTNCADTSHDCRIKKIVPIKGLF